MRWSSLALHVAACLALGLAGPACAQTETADGSDAASVEEPVRPKIVPYFGQGVASGDELYNAVGSVSFSMVHCEPVNDYMRNSDDRVVRATLSRLPRDFEDRGAVIDSILVYAANFAWNGCPIPFVWIDGKPTGDFHYDLDRVLIVGPNGEAVASASLGGMGLDGMGDQALGSSRRGYLWKRYVNELAETRARVAEAEAERAAAAARAQRAAEAAERGQRAAASFWWRVRLFLAGLVALWMFLKRETIARWYYSLQPHPASNMVDRAIEQGAAIDGDLYERVLRPVPGNRAEQAVRREQADVLTRRLREHEAILRSESAKRVEAERRRVERENAFLRAHAELLKAGVDHEVAAARLDELRRQARDP